MSSTVRFTALAVALGLVVSACSENVTPTAVDSERAMAPTMAPSSIINAPENSGPWVVRGEFRQIISSFYTVTPDGNAWIGWTGVPRDPNDLLFCGADASLAEFIAFSSVERPARLNDLLMGIDRRLVFWNAEEFNAVWNTEGLCAALELRPIAEGTATHEINNDNDLFGQTGHNAWGYKLHGTAGDYVANYHIKAQFTIQQGFRVLTESGSVH